MGGPNISAELLGPARLKNMFPQRSKYFRGGPIITEINGSPQSKYFIIFGLGVPFSRNIWTWGSFLGGGSDFFVTYSVTGIAWNLSLQM